MRDEFINIKQELSGIYLTICGRENCKSDFVYPPNIRSYYIIHCVTDGVGFFSVHGVKTEIKKGDIFIISPNEVISYGCTQSENPLSFCWVGFFGRDADRCINQMGLKTENGVFSLPFGREKQIAKDFYAIKQYADNANPLSQIKLTSLLLSALATLQSAMPQWEKSSDEPEYAVKAVAFIQNHYMQPITITDIASYAQIERSYLFRLFKKAYKISPQQFLISCRIENACRLIENTNSTITQIAQYVGIHDVYYFSKLFKSILGISPTQYRKNAKL